MCIKKNNAFTLIETLSVLAIGGMVTLDQIKEKKIEIEDGVNSNVARQMVMIFNGIEKRVNVDEYAATSWDPSTTNSLGSLINNLNGAGSSCSTGVWEPSGSDAAINAEYRVKSLVPCSGLLPNKIYGFDINFDIVSASGKIKEVKVSINKGGNSFTQKNIRDFELMMDKFITSFKSKPYYSADFYALDGTKGTLLDCLASPDGACIPTFTFDASVYNRNFDNVYLKLDGTNGLKNGGYHFQNADGTFKNCETYKEDTSGITKGAALDTPGTCGVDMDDGTGKTKIITEGLSASNIYSNKTFSTTVTSELVEANSVSANDVDTNILSAGKIRGPVGDAESPGYSLDIGGSSVFKNLYLNTLNVSGSSVLSGTTVNGALRVNGNSTTVGNSTVTGTATMANEVVTGNSRVNGVSTTSNLAVTNLATINRLAGNLEIGKKVDEGSRCWKVGRVALSRDNYLLVCKSDAMWSGILRWAKEESCRTMIGANLNSLPVVAGGKGCINGYALGNAPTGDWFFIDYARHTNPNNYYATQTAKGMTGAATNRVWVRTQVNGAWRPWVENTPVNPTLKARVVSNRQYVNSSGTLYVYCAAGEVALEMNGSTVFSITGAKKSWSHVGPRLTTYYAWETVNAICIKI